jgi:hypothetical protein
MFLQHPPYKSSHTSRHVPHEKTHSILHTCGSEPRWWYAWHVLDSLTIAEKSMCRSIRPVEAPSNSGKSSINRISRESELVWAAAVSAIFTFRCSVQMKLQGFLLFRPANASDCELQHPLHGDRGLLYSRDFATESRQKGSQQHSPWQRGLDQPQWARREGQKTPAQKVSQRISGSEFIRNLSRFRLKFSHFLLQRDGQELLL